MKNYKLVNTHPVAKFYYKGGHSHPVQRTVLITETDENHITGYEVRCGHVVRQPNAAPIKTYSRDKIAKVERIRAKQDKNRLLLSKGPKQSTLRRTKLYDYLFSGP